MPTNNRAESSTVVSTDSTGPRVQRGTSRSASQHPAPETQVPTHLAEQLRAGSSDAFEYLYCEYHERLLSLAMRLTGSKADAEDVVQETFINTIRHHHQFRGDAQPSTWIYRVAYNTALMKLRSKRRKGADSLDAMGVDAAQTQIQRDRENRTPVVSPEEITAQHDLSSILEEALSSLKPADRAIVRMRFCDGMSTQEVGEALGMTQSAVKTRLHRARAQLQERCDLRGISQEWL